MKQPTSERNTKRDVKNINPTRGENLDIRPGPGPPMLGMEQIGKGTERQGIFFWKMEMLEEQ